MSQNKNLRPLCECAMFTAAALVLSFLKIPIGLEFGGFGGSIDFVMIPIIICAIRWGIGWGIGTGLVFGALKFFIAGGSAINWESMLLDYVGAYMFVGLAGVFRHKASLSWLAALIGCVGRFFIHFLSGVTIYAAYVSPIFGWDGSSSVVYSVLYNGSYMIPNTILAVVVCALLQAPMKKYLNGSDLKS